MAGGPEMYAALSAVCAHEARDIIMHQQAEIAKLRAELADVQKAHDKLMAGASRMTHRIFFINGGQPEIEMDHLHGDLDRYMRISLEQLPGDIEANVAAARSEEVNQYHLAETNVDIVDPPSDESDMDVDDH